jgi:thiomorpholine-carboxylate dehydrogenase
MAKIFAEAGVIFAGTKHTPAGATVFKSVGIAAEDIAAAWLVHAAAAREHGLESKARAT